VKLRRTSNSTPIFHYAEENPRSYRRSKKRPQKHHFPARNKSLIPCSVIRRAGGVYGYTEGIPSLLRERARCYGRSTENHRSRPLGGRSILPGWPFWPPCPQGESIEAGRAKETLTAGPDRGRPGGEHPWRNGRPPAPAGGTISPSREPRWGARRKPIAPFTEAFWLRRDSAVHWAWEGYALQTEGSSPWWSIGLRLGILTPLWGLWDGSAH